MKSMLNGFFLSMYYHAKLRFVLGRFLAVILAFFLSSQLAFAQELQANFHDWKVFKVNRGDQVVCYAASLPIKRSGFRQRGESYFLVTDIVNDADEIGVSSGFYYDKDSDVEVSFGAKKFYLFPFKAMAWANDKNEDIDIIKAMQKNADMIVSGVDKDGRVVSDTYSLIGFAQSYEKMQEICKEKEEEVEVKEDA